MNSLPRRNSFIKPMTYFLEQCLKRVQKISMITKPIAIYARVSTARQEDEQTILTQISVLQEHALKNNYTIIESYLDEGWSGDTLVRPSLDKLRQDVKKKMWQAVLIYDPD